MGERGDGRTDRGVAYTLKIRSGCEGGGKGALIQTDKSATLATNNDQYLFQPVTLEPGIAQREGGHIYEGVSGTLRANAGDNQMAVAFADSHILDDQGGSQINVRTDGKAPTLRAEMHGNVPCVMEPKPVYCLQGNGIDRADTAGCNGKGVKEDICYTLNTIDRPAVAYSLETFHCTSEEEKTTTLKARDYKDHVCVAYGVDEQPISIDRAFFNQGQNAAHDPQFYQDGTVPTLVARGPSAAQIRYIVRRLTPTECARLQGFADAWAVPDSKEDFTDEEYRFWLTVRNTHAEINGKTVKDYTKAQMLTWYNKLHTDGSEYKLWGNGIALPTALYVMQGISDVLKGEITNV